MSRFRHDPAVPMPPLPAIAAAADLGPMSESQRGFAVNHLRRGQNRLVAALREAKRKAEAAAG